MRILSLGKFARRGSTLGLGRAPRESESGNKSHALHNAQAIGSRFLPKARGACCETLFCTEAL